MGWRERQGRNITNATNDNVVVRLQICSIHVRNLVLSWDNDEREMETRNSFEV